MHRPHWLPVYVLSDSVGRCCELDIIARNARHAGRLASILLLLNLFQWNFRGFWAIQDPSNLFLYGSGPLDPRNQSTRHTVNSSHCKIVWLIDRHVSWHCYELTILSDLAFIVLKRFAIASDFEIALAAMTCHVLHVCAPSRFFQVSTPTLIILAMIQWH